MEGNENSTAIIGIKIHELIIQVQLHLTLSDIEQFQNYIDEVEALAPLTRTTDYMKISDKIPNLKTHISALKKIVETEH